MFSAFIASEKTIMLFVIVTIGIPGLVDSSRACDNGWRAYNNHCYWFSNDNATFSHAVSNCINIGSNLIEINGKTEENWLVLQSEIKGYKNFWIGLTDILVANEYVLVSTCVQPPYSNWANGQPESGNAEHCAGVYVLQREWHDYVCDTEMYYICKKPATYA
ncbi:collectin-12-like [Crassostrea virginica]